MQGSFMINRLSDYSVPCWRDMMNFFSDSLTPQQITSEGQNSKSCILQTSKLKAEPLPEGRSARKWQRGIWTQSLGSLPLHRTPQKDPEAHGLWCAAPRGAGKQARWQRVLERSYAFWEKGLWGLYSRGWGWKYRHEDWCRRGDGALRAHAESFISATSVHDCSYGADSSQYVKRTPSGNLIFY